MDNNKANRSIKCTVSSCEHHNCGENYCCLDTVCIGTHEAHPSQCQCVDCESFTAK